MSKKFTIICFALLGLLADILCFRQTLAAHQQSSAAFFSLLLSQIFIASALIACVFLFARKIRFKRF